MWTECKYKLFQFYSICLRLERKGVSISCFQLFFVKNEIHESLDHNTTRRHIIETTQAKISFEKFGGTTPSFSLSAFERHHSTKHHFDHHIMHNSNSNNNNDFHQAFHRQQRASHRAIFGGEVSTSHNRLSNNHSHSHNNNHNSHNHDDHIFGRGKTASRPAREFAWRSDDEHSNSNLQRLSERWRRSRSSPPRGRHWLDSTDVFHERRHHNRHRATSHNDLPRGLHDEAEEDWLGLRSNRMPGFGFRSAHDLHAANEARASRPDLRDIRDQLLNRAGEARASRRSLTKDWDPHCKTCTGAINRSSRQNFHSYNPRSPSTDSEDLILGHHRHQGHFRY